jgi:hypothetical protein
MNIAKAAKQMSKTLEEKLNGFARELFLDADIDAVLVLASLRTGDNSAELKHGAAGSPHTHIGMLTDARDLIRFIRDDENGERPAFRSDEDQRS